MEEFETEYLELGRKASMDDLTDYLKMKLIIDKHVGGEKKYQLLAAL